MMENSYREKKILKTLLERSEIWGTHTHVHSFKN